MIAVLGVRAEFSRGGGEWGGADFRPPPETHHVQSAAAIPVKGAGRKIGGRWHELA